MLIVLRSIIKDVHLLDEGDLGGCGDELEGKTPNTHRGHHVPSSNLRWLVVHLKRKNISFDLESFPEGS